MLQKRELRLPDSPYNKSVTIYTEADTRPKACILYFHGGGLLYGNRNDLPAKHLKVLTEAGYAIAAFDYPLSPAAKLDFIMEDIVASINDYITNSIAYVESKLPYFLWGRSAGAYLCLIAASKGKLLQKPAGVLSYYGYGFLVDGWYNSPSRYYCKLAKVPESCLKVIPDKVHAIGPLDTHYGVYVYARQTGLWKNLIYDGREKFFFLDYSLRLENSFPCPLFCAHSMNDNDVPYNEFLELCARYNPTRFIAAASEHDFDRDENGRYTDKLLAATLAFLDEKTPRHFSTGEARNN